MAVDFYKKWLGVPPGPRPPDYYTLLGVEVFCDDLEVIDTAAQFETLVWKHLRKWKLNAHEQRLLLAEALALGVAPDAALSIIQRKDHEAEILAEKKHRRQIGAVIGLAAGVVAALIVGVILFVSSSDLTRSLNERNFPASIASGGSGGITIWDAAGGRAVRTLAGKLTSSGILAFSRGGNRLVSAKYDVMQLWNIEALVGVRPVKP